MIYVNSKSLHLVSHNLVYCMFCRDIFTLILLIFFRLFFIHLKLKLLTQFPAPNDEKY